MTPARISRRLLCAVLLLGPGLAELRAAPAEPARGEQVYARCLGCHTPARHSVGPRHCGLWGRRAGTAAGFAYSDAMKRSGLVWDGATLDRFLASPLTVVPGTAMTYDGVKDPRDRRDLLGYLKQLDSSAECRSPGPHPP